MYRTALEILKTWKNKSNRKPLVLRGARQVGKSWLARKFAKIAGLDLFEINFELEEQMADCFDPGHPKEIIALLELKRSQRIINGKTLLFLDEIQAAPRVLASLRYFYEIMPELHVMAAGSLLDFALEDHQFSMPVGRIEYLHLGPMTFGEFLAGTGKAQLAEFLETWQVTEKLPGVIHNELMSQFRLFLAVGGMPEAVEIFRQTGSLLEVDGVKQSILQTFKDDFSKYGHKVDATRVGKVFQRLPLLVGQKLKYVHIDKTDKSANLKKALHLLALARVYYPVLHTAAGGIPLRAQSNEKFIKPLFLDVGLLMSACGMSYTDIKAVDDTTLINSGPICEQAAGQLLLYRDPPFREPELFYWCREKRQSAAEVDYLISHGPRIIPVEIKAGKTGTLKSLHVFLNEKRLNIGVRFNADLPGFHDVPFSLPHTRGSFTLLSLPLYMVEALNRLFDTGVCV